MITLGVAAILYELANKLDFTGGADGLQGVSMGSLLGRFEFDLYGRTAFAYSLVLLVVGLLIARRIVASPFGWSLRAIRDNRLRAAAIGLNVDLRLGAVYTIAAAMAGTAGALVATAGVTRFFSGGEQRSSAVYLFDRSSGALVRMLPGSLSSFSPEQVNRLCFSRDGQRLVVGHARTASMVFEVPSGRVLAANLEQRRDEFAARLQALCGGPIARASDEVAQTVARIMFYAAHADKFDGAVHPTRSRNVTLAMPEPWGVMGIVCPDEAPLLSLISLTMPAIAMGNRVVAIPSAVNPLPALDLYQVLDTSDVPAGVARVDEHGDAPVAEHRPPPFAPA